MSSNSKYDGASNVSLSELSQKMCEEKCIEEVEKCKKTALELADLLDLFLETRDFSGRKNSKSYNFWAQIGALVSSLNNLPFAIFDINKAHKMEKVGSNYLDNELNPLFEICRFDTEECFIKFHFLPLKSTVQYSTFTRKVSSHLSKMAEEIVREKKFSTPMFKHPKVEYVAYIGPDRNKKGLADADNLDFSAIQNALLMLCYFDDNILNIDWCVRGKRTENESYFTLKITENEGEN